ncbi:hypothetical protein GGR92_005129 [Spirosoma lacussanchae]
MRFAHGFLFSSYANRSVVLTVYRLVFRILNRADSRPDRWDFLRLTLP